MLSQSETGFEDAARRPEWRMRLLSGRLDGSRQVNRIRKLPVAGLYEDRD